MSGHRSGKRPWLVALLAFIYPGLGHIYLREWLRALLWFGLVFTTTALALPDSAIPESGGFSLDAVMAASRAISTEASLALLLLLALNIVDAYRLARVGNQRSIADDEGESRCPHCGRETDTEFEFCQWCSEPLDSTNA